MTPHYSERVALVTGGASGFGRPIAERFARAGYRIAIHYSSSKEKAESLAARLGDTAFAVRADVRREAEVKAMMDKVVERFGRLDILVNNAGWSTRVPHENLDGLTEEIWDRTLDTNLRGLFYCTRAAVPHLRLQPGAAIVNIGSAAAFTGSGSSIIYAASKAAVVNMTRSLARTLAPAIRVNSVCPGVVQTGFAGWSDEFCNALAAVTPLRRNATPEEVAEAVYYLAVVATASTSEALLVDGGITSLGRMA